MQRFDGKISQYASSPNPSIYRVECNGKMVPQGQICDGYQSTVMGSASFDDTAYRFVTEEVKVPVDVSNPWGLHVADSEMQSPECQLSGDAGVYFEDDNEGVDDESSSDESYDMESCDVDGGPLRGSKTGEPLIPMDPDDVYTEQEASTLTVGARMYRQTRQTMQAQRIGRDQQRVKEAYRKLGKGKGTQGRHRICFKSRRGKKRPLARPRQPPRKRDPS